MKTLREQAGISPQLMGEYLDIDTELLLEIESNRKAITIDQQEKLDELFDLGIIFQWKSLLKTISLEEMRSIAAISRIAMNSRYMADLSGQSGTVI